MNRAVTIVYRDGVPSVHTGPEVPEREQRVAFKELGQTGVKGCEQVEMWTSNGGMVKRKKFSHRKPRKPQARKPEPAPVEDAKEAPSPTPEPQPKPAKGKKGK